MVDVLRNSQQLWLPEEDMQKNKPLASKNSSTDRAMISSLHRLLRRYWLLLVMGRGNSLYFADVATD